MSFILDALRKAEDKNRDRHKMTVPAGPRVVTEDLPEAPLAERSPILAWLIAGLLLVALGWWLLKDRPVTSEPASSNEAPVVHSAPAPVQRQSEPARTSPAERTAIPRETGARALDREAQRGTQRREVASVNNAEGNPRQSTRAPSTSLTTSSGTAGPVTPGTVTILNADGSEPAAVTPGQVLDETLPDYQTSIASGEVPIPELHLDMHVYSTEPHKRFVFINLEKYGEGDTIAADTTIESIEPKGAVINHKGYRFVLLPD